MTYPRNPERIPIPSHPGILASDHQVARMKAIPTSPTIVPSSANIRSHSLCGEPSRGSPYAGPSSLYAR